MEEHREHDSDVRAAIDFLFAAGMDVTGPFFFVGGN
jgi:hypothetical protein